MDEFTGETVELIIPKLKFRKKLDELSSSTVWLMSDFIDKQIEKDKIVELYNEEIHVFCSCSTSQNQYRRL